MEHEQRQWPIQKRRAAQSRHRVQARAALAPDQTVLGCRLVEFRVCGQMSERRGHCKTVWHYRCGHRVLVAQAWNTTQDNERSTRHQALGCGRLRQSDVEQARGTEPSMVGWRDARATGVLHQRRLAMCVCHGLAERQGYLSALRSLQRRSARHANARSSHSVICGLIAKGRSIKSCFAMRDLPSFRPFEEKC